jgi:hypothetical protein
MKRRSFIAGVAAAVVAVLTGAARTRGAAGDPEFSLSSATVGKCGTCGFWGGVRKIAADGKTVSFRKESASGWCNNPKSPNYHKKTTPGTGPMASWRKWDALT